MSTALAQASPEQIALTFGDLFNYMDRMEEFENTIIELLPYGSDNEVIQTRQYARTMGKAGWRIECACDAVLLAREPAKRGRGQKDIQGEGRISAAKERAKEIGCASSTVRRNAQLYNTFKKVLNVQHNLDDKGYYEAALRAPDPKKAARMFEREKEANPNFSVRDAFRLAKTLKDAKPSIHIANRDDYLDPHFKSFLVEVENTLASFRNRCPRVEFAVRIDQWIRTTRFERARTPQSDFDAIKKQVDEGACTWEEIAEEVYLSEPEIKSFCVQLVGCEIPTKKDDKREAGTDYEWRPIGANTEVAKGSRQYGVFRKDAPSGDAFRYSKLEDEE